jgi:hypothetical protein
MGSHQRGQSRVVRCLIAGLVIGALSQVTSTSTALADEAAGSAQCTVCDDHGSTPGTTGDQSAGSVVTSGATHFPHTSPDSPLGIAVDKVKDCTDCQWAVSPACLDSGPNDAALCAGATVGCDNPGDLRFRVYLRHGDGPWELVGTVCLGPTDRPTTVTDIGEVVRDRVVNYLPDAYPSFQPKAGGIVNLPTLFSAGEDPTLRTEPFDVLGFAVVVTASARWEWTFAPGVTQAFSEPGGGYPDQSVSHTYAGPGERRVSVTTYWRAQFTVNGEGPFAVPGPDLSKTAGPFTVAVRAAHSELVGG